MTAAAERAELALATTPVERTPDRLAGRPTSRADVLTALGIALVVVVVAFVIRSPLVPTDPWHYVQLARHFPSTNDWNSLGYTRYGIILATIPAASVFGNAEVTYYVLPLASAATLAAVLYLIGRRFWGRVAGVVAVVVFFLFTIVLYNLTRGYPDLMAMALICAAVYVALLARDRLVAGHRAIGWLLLVGFLLGWAFEVRETAAMSWPIVLFILWLRGSILRAYSVVLLPLLAWAAADITISAIAYGDPLLKFHTLVPLTASDVPTDPTVPKPRVLEKSRLDHFLTIPMDALKTRLDGGWMVVTGIITVAVLFVRNWPLRLMSLWFISVYGLNVLAGGVLSPDRLFGDLGNVRYWTQYFAPIALVIGGLAGLVAARAVARWRLTGIRAVAVTTVVALVAVAVPVFNAARYVPNTPTFAINGGDAMEKLRTHLGEIDYSVGTVWTDRRTLRILPAYQRPFFGGAKVWTGKPRSLTAKGEPRPGDAVLLYSTHDDTCSHCRIHLWPWLLEHPSVPPNWKLIYRTESSNIEMYEVK